MAKSTDNQFGAKLIAGVNDTREAAQSKHHLDCVSAMRKFVKNVFPVATEKAKSGEGGDYVEGAVDRMEYDPDRYVHNFKIFHRFIEVSLSDLI